MSDYVLGDIVAGTTASFDTVASNVLIRPDVASGADIGTDTIPFDYTYSNHVVAHS